MNTVIEEIRHVLEANAAPFTVEFALKEMSRQGKKVAIDCGLILKLLDSQKVYKCTCNAIPNAEEWDMDVTRKGDCPIHD